MSGDLVKLGSFYDGMVLINRAREIFERNLKLLGPRKIEKLIQEQGGHGCVIIDKDSSSETNDLLYLVILPVNTREKIFVNNPSQANSLSLQYAYAYRDLYKHYLEDKNNVMFLEKLNKGAAVDWFSSLKDFVDEYNKIREQVSMHLPHFYYLVLESVWDGMVNKRVFTHLVDDVSFEYNRFETEPYPNIATSIVLFVSLIGLVDTNEIEHTQELRRILGETEKTKQLEAEKDKIKKGSSRGKKGPEEERDASSSSSSYDSYIPTTDDIYYDQGVQQGSNIIFMPDDTFVALDQTSSSSSSSSYIEDTPSHEQSNIVHINDDLNSPTSVVSESKEYTPKHVSDTSIVTHESIPSNRSIIFIDDTSPVNTAITTDTIPSSTVHEEPQSSNIIFMPEETVIPAMFDYSRQPSYSPPPSTSYHQQEPIYLPDFVVNQNDFGQDSYDSYGSLFGKRRNQKERDILQLEAEEQRQLEEALQRSLFETGGSSDFDINNNNTNPLENEERRRQEIERLRAFEELKKMKIQSEQITSTGYTSSTSTDISAQTLKSQIHEMVETGKEVSVGAIEALDDASESIIDKLVKELERTKLVLKEKETQLHATTELNKKQLERFENMINNSHLSSIPPTTSSTTTGSVGSVGTSSVAVSLNVKDMSLLRSLTNQDLSIIAANLKSIKKSLRTDIVQDTTLQGILTASYVHSVQIQDLLRQFFDQKSTFELMELLTIATDTSKLHTSTETFTKMGNLPLAINKSLFVRLSGFVNSLMVDQTSSIMVKRIDESAATLIEKIAPTAFSPWQIDSYISSWFLLLSTWNDMKVYYEKLSSIVEPNIHGFTDHIEKELTKHILENTLSMVHSIKLSLVSVIKKSTSSIASGRDMHSATAVGTVHKKLSDFYYNIENNPYFPPSTDGLFTVQPRSLLIMLVLSLFQNKMPGADEKTEMILYVQSVITDWMLHTWQVFYLHHHIKTGAKATRNNKPQWLAEQLSDHLMLLPCILDTANPVKRTLFNSRLHHYSEELNRVLNINSLGSPSPLGSKLDEIIKNNKDFILQKTTIGEVLDEIFAGFLPMYSKGKPTKKTVASNPQFAEKASLMLNVLKSTISDNPSKEQDNWFFGALNIIKEDRRLMNTYVDSADNTSTSILPKIITTIKTDDPSTLKDELELIERQLKDSVVESIELPNSENARNFAYILFARSGDYLLSANTGGYTVSTYVLDRIAPQADAGVKNTIADIISKKFLLPKDWTTHDLTNIIRFQYPTLAFAFYVSLFNGILSFDDARSYTDNLDVINAIQKLKAVKDSFSPDSLFAPETPPTTTGTTEGDNTSLGSAKSNSYSVHVISAHVSPLFTELNNLRSSISNGDMEGTKRSSESIKSLLNTHSFNLQEDVSKQQQQIQKELAAIRQTLNDPNNPTHDKATAHKIITELIIQVSESSVSSLNKSNNGNNANGSTSESTNINHNNNNDGPVAPIRSGRRPTGVSLNKLSALFAGANS